MGTDQRKRTGRLKLIAGNLVVLAGLLGVIFGVGEIYYRFFFDSTDSFGLTRVCERWFDRHYQFNTATFRDNVEYSSAIIPGMRRVTFLGDSFTAGHGVADVDDRFGNIVRSVAGDPVDIHVLGVNGFDTGAELETLTKLADSGYGMDVVVLVYVLNDISDIVPEWQEIIHRIYIEEKSDNFFVKHSYFINSLYYRIKAARDPDISDYYGFVRSAYDGPLWDVQTARLRGIADLVRSHDARLMVVTFPFLHAIGDDYAYRDVHGKLGAFWNELGVPHLDLLPVFEEHKPGKLVVGKVDAHPNEFAHELAADAIVEFLEPELK